MNRPLRGILLGSVVLLAGCASCTSNETDPRRISTCQLLVGNDKLQQHLAQRRQYLAELGTRIEALDAELLSGQAELFKLKGELDKASIPERELQQLRRDIDALEAEQGQLEDQLGRSKEEVVRLQAAVDRAPAQDAALEKQLQEAHDNVARMEKKIEIVSGGIKRTVALRLKYS